ncbi:MAG: hypothetical protein ACT4P5_01585 [Armatimonadota bacterium]
MREFLSIIAFIVLAMPAAAEETVTVLALVQHPDRYDGEVVRVTGAVGAYRDRVSGSGHPYSVFHLREGRASVMVFAWPHQDLRDGLRARVTGTFVKVKTFTFIKAQRTVVLR